MKQKYVAILLGAAMVMSTAGTTAAGLTVMAEESVTENSTKSTTEAGNAAVTDETAQKNDSGQDKEPDKNERPEEDENQVRGEITAVGESSVTIKTDAGDETEISITDDTEITRQSMGGPGGAPQGQPGENGEAPQGQPGGEQETIALSDLAKGDQIMITLNDDGTAASITVMSMDGGQGGGMAPGGAPGG